MIHHVNMNRVRVPLILCVVAGLIGFTPATLLAPPVGGVKDHFLADNSPKAVAFRDAWYAAIEVEGHLEPLPEGVTGEEQRRLVISAFEKAIAIMPEAPPCPDLLLKIGFYWNSSAVAPAEPAKALAAYARVRNDYPANDRAVIQAICGQASTLMKLKRPTAAARVFEEVYNYQLPEYAPEETVRMLQRIQKEMQLHRKWYRTEAAREQAAIRETVLFYKQTLLHHLANAVWPVVGNVNFKPVSPHETPASPNPSTVDRQ
ncbi:MAG: hypothetical protein FWE88_02120 [Phycisphaerae bacterium]|nr:hypothetical protein [Phycisphaerae bacterium]